MQSYKKNRCSSFLFLFFFFFVRKRTRSSEKERACAIKYILYCSGKYSSYTESPNDSGFKLYFSLPIMLKII